MKFVLLFDQLEKCKFLCYLTYFEDTCGVLLLNDDAEKALISERLFFHDLGIACNNCINKNLLFS